MWVNNPRWEGVPFILKAGKGKISFIVVVMAELVDLRRVCGLKP